MMLIRRATQAFITWGCGRTLGYPYHTFSPRRVRIHNNPPRGFSTKRDLNKLHQSANPETTKATKVDRIVIGELFEGRKYIFSMKRNIRSYEWTENEAGELWDDLLDEALQTKREPQDYELQQISLVPTTEPWKTEKYGAGCRYDVLDGQQRLITLSLIFAAIRDSLRSCLHNEETEGSLEELHELLNPPKARKQPVMRVELRKRDGMMLERILKANKMLQKGEEGEQIDLSITSGDLLTNVDKRIVQNYNMILKNACELDQEDKQTVIDFLQERVYLLVCDWQDPKIARSIILGQSKGKDLEPIDDFKALVCYRECRPEDEDEILEQWDSLASDEGVGRNIVSDASLIMASSRLRMRPKKKNAVYSTELLEKWMKMELEHPGCSGREFFEQSIEPASHTLKEFREGSYTPDGITSNTQTLDIAMRLRFLRAAAQVTTAETIELVVLPLLLENINLDQLEERLKELEVLALWMMVAKPTVTKRVQRCFDILDWHERTAEPFLSVISSEEIAQVKDALDSVSFGSSPQGKKAASAILERLNAHELSLHSQSSMPECTALQLEHILPQKANGDYWSRRWPHDGERKVWTHRLGNLAILNQKSNAKASNKAFSSKKDLYKNSPYPLTRILLEEHEWDLGAVKSQHQKIQDLAYEVWGL